MSLRWSNLAKIVYRRTYARHLNDDRSLPLEKWPQTVERVIRGNLSLVSPDLLMPYEGEILERLALERKAIPAGRGIWFSGASAHKRVGGAGVTNCWYFSMDDWRNFAIIQDMLMLGGGVGASVEQQFVSKLPVIKDVSITENHDGADFFVADSREGWCDLTYRIFEAFFVTGKSFTFSAKLVRPAGLPIKGFGGTSSGPASLIEFANKIIEMCRRRVGYQLRTIDVADIICATGEMVVAGNIRRSAILLLGDAWDEQYLTAKRWDLGQPIPNQRAYANWSVVAAKSEELGPLFWATYENGEPFGIVNRENIQKYGRMGELKPDTAVGVNPCVAGETEILTKSGYKRIDSLVNQAVEVWNGFEWSEVTPKITGYEQPMLKIQLSDGRSLRCTTAHKWAIVDGYEPKQVQSRIAASELKIGQKLLKVDYPVLEAGKIVSDKFAYTQGFISADGMNGYSYCQVYAPKEMCIPRLSGKIGKFNEKSKKWLVHFDDDFYSKDFVPFSWNVSSRLSWLAGLFDGDGTELKEGGVQVASVDAAFLRNVQKMLTICGVASKVAPLQEPDYRLMPDGNGGKKEYFCQKIERLLIGAEAVQRLVSLGMKCERLTLDKSPNRDASCFVTVVGVEESGIEGMVYCFTENKRNLGCFDGVVTGQCAEATLESGESCNLWEQNLFNLKTPEDFLLACKMGMRYTKRVSTEQYHHEISSKVIAKNRRVGLGITGCLAAPDLFNPSALDAGYQAVLREDREYSAVLGINESIRHTVVKPSGTLSKKMDTPLFCGIHGAYSKFIIQRIRFAANDPLVPLLRAAGHPLEYVERFDGTLDTSTIIAEFYLAAEDGAPCVDQGFDTWRQLDTLLMAQRYWSDQAVSVTVYYKKQEIPEVRDWIAQNLNKIKTISFLCHEDHGFKQAPWEAISEAQYYEKSNKIKQIDLDDIGAGAIESQECAGGACPVR